MDISDISSLTSYASNLATTKTTSDLTNKANSAETDEEMMEACKEFESYLWEQVVKSMKETTNIFGDEDSSSSQMVDYFMDTAISEISSSITEQTSGPNSLAQQMYEQMKRTNTISAETLQANQQETADNAGTEAVDTAEENISIANTSAGNTNTENTNTENTNTEDTNTEDTNTGNAGTGNTNAVNA